MTSAKSAHYKLSATRVSSRPLISSTRIRFTWLFYANLSTFGDTAWSCPLLHFCAVWDETGPGSYWDSRSGSPS